MKNFVIIVGILMCGLAIMLPACVTTRGADGVSTTQVDLATTIALTQLALTTAQTAYDDWMAHQEKVDAVAAAEKERQIAVLKAALAGLQAMAAKSNVPDWKLSLGAGLAGVESAGKGTTNINP